MTTYIPLWLQVVDNSKVCIYILEDRFNDDKHKLYKEAHIKPNKDKKRVVGLLADNIPWLQQKW